ncbi:MAG: DUF4397 domain-containing protein [Bacteroidota bacterium]
MKKLIYPIFLTGLIVAIAASCEDEQVFFKDITVAEGARVKFVHGASDAAGVDFFLNNSKISSGSTSGTATAYALTYPGTNYAAVEAGSYEVRATVPATTSTSEINLVTGSLAVENDRYYTIALVGVSPNYETATIADDEQPTPADGQAYIRLVNLIHNSANNLSLVGTPPVPAGGPPVTLASNVGFKKGSPFIAITPGLYTSVQLKDAGSGTVIATLSAANSTFAGNKVYTIFARGQLGLTASDPKRALVDRMINR